MNEYLEATGYDWVEYETDEKQEVISAIYEILKLPEIASEEVGIRSLNDFYAQLASDYKENPEISFDKIMNTPCIKIITTIIKTVVKKDTNDNK
ncbi:MAG: hypothetical protein PHQ52_05895 [Candidatus Omnitrophica bacterium]|nr:hypothetical protein [Candidatus Omnitrophota bacterium]